ncbi:MAG: hypothetical protein KIH44_003520 [Octadecabacter sp.]|nr:hypothetical protein [Octadecabacter sp.]
MGRRSFSLRRFLSGPLGLFCFGVLCLVLLWKTGIILFFWGGFVGVVGGLLKWRFSYPSYGNSKTEHQAYRAWW